MAHASLAQSSRRLTRDSPEWQGAVVMARSWLLYRGPVGATALHAHHAHQIVLSYDAPIALRDREGHVVHARTAVLSADSVHGFDSGSRDAVVLLVDPETPIGRRLGQHAATLPRDWVAAGEPLRQVLRDDIPTLTSAWVRGLLERLVDLASPPPPAHPALRRALVHIASILPAAVRGPDVARAAGVSPSHLTRLFGQQLGTSMRVYVLWSRLLHAGAALEQRASIAEAAHRAGFSDAAHQSRTFRRMFGITPSDLAQVTSWTVLRGDDAP